MAKKLELALSVSNKAFVLAEIAGAHEGSADNMKALIKIASDGGADGVKFQIFKSEELVVKSHPKFSSFKAKEFSKKQWKEFADYARSLKLHVFADVFDKQSLETAEEMGVEAYKVHSTIISDVYLLGDLAKTGKPVLLGIGGSDYKEIMEALKILKDNQVIILAGYQNFPTKLEDSNLNLMETLKSEFKLPVGYSDHCDADTDMAMILPLLAVAKGTCVIEKHITIDRQKKGTDYYSALNLDELKKMVRLIRETEKTLGRSTVGGLSDDEKAYRLKMKKFIVAAKDIKKGEKISLKMLAFKRVADVKPEAPGLYPNNAEKLIGKPALHNIKADELVRLGDVKHKVAILIAVRMKSTRLPKKAFQMIEGQTLINHLIDRMKASKNSDYVVLCTSKHPDDKVLLEVAAKKKIPSVAGSEEDVMGRFLEAAKKVGADIIIRVTGDNPLTCPEFIDSAIEHHLKQGADYTYTTELPQGTKGEVITVASLQKAHDLAEDPNYSEYMTWYFTENPQHWKIERAPVIEACKRPQYRFSVDTPEDLELMRQIYKRLYKPGKIVPLKDACKLLDDNPELAKINANVEKKDIAKMKSQVNVRLRWQ